MPKTSPLDLAAIDPAIWRVFVGDEPYGPYTLGQVRSFIDEGRVTAKTLITKAGRDALVPASTVAELQDTFVLRKDDAAADSEETGTTANYVITTDLKRTSEVDLIICLNGLGEFTSVLPGTFVLSSPRRLHDVQKTISAATTLDDQIIIVNASTGRLGWLNIGTDTDIHLRELWAKAEEEETAKSE
ncbi:MAG: DUF4339 domain-containing protein [Pseudomonadota bacterium]